MGTKEKVLRVVEATEGGLFREKRILITLEANESGAVVKELSRVEEMGDLFRAVADGEEPTDRIMDEQSYDVRLLIKVQQETPPVEAKVEPTIPEPVQDVAKKPVKKPVKKSAKKPAKKPAKKAVQSRPSFGQNGPVIDDLTSAMLNRKERKVVEALAQAPKPMKISELALTCWPHEPKTRRNSWVRNSLRRLVRGALVVKVDEGTYKPTGLGRKSVAA